MQVYLHKQELDTLRKAAARSGRSVAELVRDAIRKVVLKPQAAGPVAIWDGELVRIVHLIRNSLGFVFWKDRKAILPAITAI